MRIDFVRDNRGRAIGISHIYNDGRREIRLTSGRILGWYNPAMNRTLRVAGNIMGEGDQPWGCYTKLYKPKIIITGLFTQKRQAFSFI